MLQVFSSQCSNRIILRTEVVGNVLAKKHNTLPNLEWAFSDTKEESGTVL